jgi:hypothetical protein
MTNRGDPAGRPWFMGLGEGFGGGGKGPVAQASSLWNLYPPKPPSPHPQSLDTGGTGVSPVGTPAGLRLSCFSRFLMGGRAHPTCPVRGAHLHFFSHRAHPT